MGKYLDSIGLSHLVAKIKSMFTANVHITDENIDLSTTPSSGIYHRVIQIDDANGDCIGWVQAHQDENGAHGISIGTNDLNDPDGTTHQIMLSMNGSTPGCWVSQAASVRSGIGAAASSHTHGSITNAGAITSDTTAASGDKLVISDDSDSSKLKRSGIALGTSTNTFLRNDGTWAIPSGGSSDLTLDDVANNQFGGDTGDWAFSYDGDAVYLEVFPRIWYGTCTSSATTYAKTASITGFKLYKGALVALQMTYTMQYSSGIITLNVSSTGAKTIYANGKTVRLSGGTGSASYDYGWHAGDTVLFMYDGSYWRIVGIKSPRTSFSVACSGVASGNITVCKSGDCVTISFNGVTTGNISARSVIATIPEGYRPPMEVYSTGNSGVVSTAGSGLMISTDGTVRADPKVKNLTLYDCITYCAWS